MHILFRFIDLNFFLVLKKLFFLGFRQGIKGYLLYVLQSHVFLISRNTIFYEYVFPFNNSNILVHPSPNPTSHLSDYDLELIHNFPPTHDPQSTLPNPLLLPHVTLNLLVP